MKCNCRHLLTCRCPILEKKKYVDVRWLYQTDQVENEIHCTSNSTYSLSSEKRIAGKRRDLSAWAAIYSGIGRRTDKGWAWRSARFLWYWLQPPIQVHKQGQICPSLPTAVTSSSSSSSTPSAGSSSSLFSWSPFLHSLSFLTLSRSIFFSLSLQRLDLSFATNVYLISTLAPNLSSSRCALSPLSLFLFLHLSTLFRFGPLALARCPICARIECKGKEKNMYIDTLLYSRSRIGRI